MVIKSRALYHVGTPTYPEEEINILGMVVFGPVGAVYLFQIRFGRNSSPIPNPKAALISGHQKPNAEEMLNISWSSSGMLRVPRDPVKTTDFFCFIMPTSSSSGGV